jgi:hypothetical protein
MSVGLAISMAAIVVMYLARAWSEFRQARSVGR